MLCKHEVTGSIPVSSTNLRFAKVVAPKGKRRRTVRLARKASAILIRCIWFAAIRKQHHLLLLESMAPIQRQAVQPFGAGNGRFHEPQGSGPAQKRGAAMFDNKIDWVTRLEWGKSAARRASRKQDSERV